MLDSRFVAHALGLSENVPAILFSAVTTDSRRVPPGSLYIALRGERFDGHDFIQAAVAAGAAGVVSERPLDLPEHVVGFQVTDSLAALQALAHAVRLKIPGPVVGITGSNGKTTTKEMMASVLRAAFGADKVLATRGNLNNHIGVPLTLLEWQPSQQAAVIEMGMNHFGEIAALTQIAEPDCAMITNAGPAHLEGVGSLEGVAKAKGEIFEGLRPSGTAILNRDDRFYAYWRVIARDFRQLSFGFSTEADIRGAWLADGRLQVRIAGAADLTLRMPLPGEHNARNALAVVAAAHALGIEGEAIRQGLEQASFVSGRLERRRLGNGAIVIDDSYNANPASMQASIAVLAQESGRRVLVLGDMAELGAHAAAGHREVATAALASGVEAIHTLGPQMEQAFAGSRARCHREASELSETLAAELTPETTLLVKGSRSMQMERIVQALLERFPGGGG